MSGINQNIPWTKPVCQLDADKLYVGQAYADLNIYARDGSYIIPGGCIDTAAPEIPENHAARWNGEGWDVIEDHRGKVAYRTDTGEAVVVETVGALAEGLTLIAPPSAYSVWQDGAWAEDEARKAADVAAALEIERARKLRAMATVAQQFVAEKSGMKNIPDFEVQTWALQAAEARAWEKDHAAPTPVLDQIAAARGIKEDSLKAAALRKTIAYEKLSATVAGQRQALEKQIEAAKSIKELEAVEIVFEVV